MPTLCTGYVGVPIPYVAIALMRSVYRDFCEHPADAELAGLKYFGVLRPFLDVLSGFERCRLEGPSLKLEFLQQHLADLIVMC